ncbi:transcription factor bHLH68-like isoform X2 [Durio zibethinus]|uniref:Transcription factor bHLH68-like isoform X2 n=1 Tax=Durio zibethinus TaxID=66656 RepID=A0A6P6BJF0_DURZI|nr:transcription factor bHLH68-like isoform X2 [Durio zibethinus]XP_022777184.1 transcription factor bHLH68-like isoform X2 [Durio zibethinus]
MMAGNPSWWSMHLHPPSPSPSLFPPPYALGSSTLPPNSLPDNQELPQSWSQLLLGGLSGEEERFGPSHHFQPKKLENWENQILNPSARVPVVDVKQEVTQNSNLYGHGDDEFQASRPASAAWSQIMPISSPRSCITSLSSNMLDFSFNKATDHGSNTQPVDHSSECNSTATGGVCKKARVQPSSSQPPLKVRKEKLGDRITALHQLVSPFGKTDTASVLLEAIGYIRFLQGQIEALSSPYLGTASSNMRNQQSVHGERNCAFPEEQGQDNQDEPKDLRSRGLCLVPVSCTQQVGSDNSADYWAPAFGGGGF